MSSLILIEVSVFTLNTFLWIKQAPDANNTSLEVASMRRLLTLFKILSFIFLILTLQLVRWQLVRADLAKMALRQRSEALPLDSGRAPILDRSGKALTGGGSRKSLGAFPVLIPKSQQEALPCNWHLSWANPGADCPDFPKGQTIFLARGLDSWQLDALKPYLGPGLVVVQEKLRYKEPALAPHLIGYLRASDQSGNRT